MAGPEQFGKNLSVWAMLTNLTRRGIGWFTFSGTPVSGSSGSLAGKAAPGSIVTDVTTGNSYVNVGTTASPIWVADSAPVGAGTGGTSGGGLGATGNAKMTYDFATDGGAISTITPANSPTLPANAIILGGTIDITVQLTSGGAATIAVGLGSGAQVAALKAATAVASWTAGQLAVIPVFTAATYVKVAAATQLTLTVAAFALNAGRFDVNLVYVQGNA
jgi:hypothetical protein